MKPLELKLVRLIMGAASTLGKFYIDGKYYGVTCEDKDRELEAGGVKIAKQTAIPRGRYRVVVTFSNRFQKMLPLLEDVPGFTGVRIHGGNTHEDTEGYILLGKVYVPATNPTGIANCAERMSTLIQMLTDAEDAGTECWITVE